MQAPQPATETVQDGVVNDQARPRKKEGIRIRRTRFLGRLDGKTDPWLGELADLTDINPERGQFDAVEGDGIGDARRF